MQRRPCRKTTRAKRTRFAAPELDDFIRPLSSLDDVRRLLVIWIRDDELRWMHWAQPGSLDDDVLQDFRVQLTASLAFWAIFYSVPCPISPDAASFVQWFESG